MIKVTNKNGVTCPILLCDVCNERIENLGLAAAVFPRSDSDGEVTDVLHVHKNSCHDRAESQLGGKAGAPWQELQDHFIWLLANSGKTVEQLAERSADLGELGLL